MRCAMSPRWRQVAAPLLKQCRFLAIERRAARWTSLPQALRRRATWVISPLCDVSSHASPPLHGRVRPVDPLAR